MGKNVLIPLESIKRIVELLEYWDITGYDRAILDEHCCILRELNAKLKKLELRDAYARIIRANDDDTRHSARIKYLRQRNHIANEYADDNDF